MLVVLINIKLHNDDLPQCTYTSTLALFRRFTLVTVLEASPEYLTSTTTNFTKASMV